MIPKKPALGLRSEGGNRLSEKIMLHELVSVAASSFCGRLGQARPAAHQAAPKRAAFSPPRRTAHAPWQSLAGYGSPIHRGLKPAPTDRGRAASAHNPPAA